MRLPKAEHEAHPWVIAQIAPDFELIDAWVLPAQGGRDDFAALLKIMASLDGANAESSHPGSVPGAISARSLARVG